MPLLSKKRKFKSPLEANKKVESILNNAPDLTDILTKNTSIKMENFEQNNVRSEDKIPDLPYSLNAPGVKEAYKKFFEKASQSSGTSSQICSTLFDSIAESNSIIISPTDSTNKFNSVYVEKYDFMKNFKNTKKRSMKNFGLKSLSNEESSISIKKKKNEIINQKKQRKKDCKKTEMSQRNQDVKMTKKKTESGQVMSVYEKMIMIQESRNIGLYVLCDKCDKAR